MTIYKFIKIIKFKQVIKKKTKLTKGELKKKNKIMNISLLLFLIGVLGFVLNRKNIILMLISLEIILLSITLLILVSSICFDDIVGQTFAIYIITIAGAESAIGLAILVAFYRLRGTIAIEPAKTY